MPENRRIFYIDDDGDNVPIDSECEFHEALKVHTLYKIAVIKPNNRRICFEFHFFYLFYLILHSFFFIVDI